MLLNHLREYCESDVGSHDRLLNVLIQTLHSNAYDASDLEDCTVYLREILGRISNLEAPVAPGFLNKVKGLSKVRVYYETTSYEEAQSVVNLIDRIYEYTLIFPNKYSKFITDPVEQYETLLDSLLNVKDLALLEKGLEELNSLPPLNTEVSQTVAETVAARLNEFIRLTNDPTSSYAELDSEVARALVKSLAKLQVDLVKPTQTETPKDTLNPQVLLDVLVARKDSKDYGRLLHALGRLLNVLPVDQQITYFETLTVLGLNHSEYHEAYLDLMSV